MAESLEDRVARLERELRSTSVESIRQTVANVARRYGRTYGFSEVVENALREMGITEEESSDTHETREIVLEVTIRSTPSPQLIIEEGTEEQELISLVEESIPDLSQYASYLLDEDWSDTEIHSVVALSVKAI